MTTSAASKEAAKFRPPTTFQRRMRRIAFKTRTMIRLRLRSPVTGTTGKIQCMAASPWMHLRSTCERKTYRTRGLPTRLPTNITCLKTKRSIWSSKVSTGSHGRKCSRPVRQSHSRNGLTSPQSSSVVAAATVAAVSQTRANRSVTSLHLRHRNSR